MLSTTKTIKNKFICGLFIFIFCAEWMFLICLNPIYYHIHNGIEVAATVIESDVRFGEARVTYQYEGKTYECLLDSHYAFYPHVPEENTVIDIMINHENPHEVISSPIVTILNFIEPLRGFILFFSFVFLFILQWKTSYKVEKKATEVDKTYITGYLMKSELLSLVFVSTVALFNIFPIMNSSVLHTLAFLICVYLMAKLIFHLIKMARDDQYIKVTKTVLKTWKYNPGTDSEDYGHYEITTNAGTFIAGKKLTRLNENDTILIVSYAGRRDHRMLLGLTENVLCKIKSNPENMKDNHKKGRILLYVLGFLAVTLCVTCMIDDYQRAHPTFHYVQQAKPTLTTEIPDIQADYTKKELSIDITTRGEVAENAVDITGKTIFINGHSYTLPMNFSDLFADGWKIPEGYQLNNYYQPNTITKLVGFFLEDSNGARLLIDQVYNPTNETTDLENCLINSLSLNDVDSTNFILPGGITKNSTAADVIEIFGNPDDLKHFESISYDENSLRYLRNVVSGVSFHFSFEPKGTIKSFSMSHDTLSSGLETPMYFFPNSKPIITNQDDIPK